MSCQNITLKKDEKRVLEYTDFSDLKIELNEGSNLVLKLANFKENSEKKRLYNRQTLPLPLGGVGEGSDLSLRHS